MAAIIVSGIMLKKQRCSLEMSILEKIGAIKCEMNNTKWIWFAICYQCGFAYIIALIINQFGNALTGMIYMLFFKKLERKM